MLDLNPSEEQKALKEYERMLAVDQAVSYDTHRTEHKFADEWQHVARIPKAVWFAARLKYGENCWDDPDFAKAWLRDNPQHLVVTTRNSKGNEISKGTIYVPPKYANANG